MTSVTSQRADFQKCACVGVHVRLRAIDKIVVEVKDKLFSFNTIETLKLSENIL